MTAVDPHFNGLSPAEAERLAFLIEELAEAQQAACKILRHGYESRNPEDKAHVGNRHALEIELGHVKRAVTFMTINRDVDEILINDSSNQKLLSALKWMHHQ